jgi:hypothetical protein
MEITYTRRSDHSLPNVTSPPYLQRNGQQHYTCICFSTSIIQLSIADFFVTQKNLKIK